MNIEEIKNQIIASTNELEHLHHEVENLNAAKENMTEEEYNRELATINKYIEEENAKLHNNTAISRAYDNMRENIIKLTELNNITPRDEQEANQIAEEQEIRESEIINSRKLLSEELQQEIRDSISKERESTKVNQELQTKKEKSNTIEYDPNFYDLDENGNLKFFDNTMIARPRHRKPEETDQEYVDFLANYYNTLREKGLFRPLALEDKSKNASKDKTEGMEGLKDNKSNIPRIEAKSDVPRIEAKSDVPRIEAKSDVPRIEAKPDVPRIEAKSDTPQKEEPKSDIPQKEEPKHKRTLDNILYNSLLVDENNEVLYVDKKTGKRLQASNVQVRKSFVNELKSGNWLYNVTHIANNTLKLAINFGRKSLAKFNLWRTNQKEIGNILDENVANLSKEDWETVRKEYIGGKINEKANVPSALNYAIEKRIRTETREQVGDINQKIAINYQTLFSTFDEINNINEKLNSSSLTESEKDYLIAEKQALLAGKGQMIKQTRDLYNYGNSLLSSGSHGFSEDVKAAESGMNKKGFRFSKRHDYDEVSQEVQRQQAILSQKESDAIVDGNDEIALNAFVNLEMLKSKETAIENSIVGKRSTGRMYYSPLVEELDYRDDPFIRDLFSTIAVVGAAVSVANAIHTHVNEANKVLDAEQAKAAQVNGANEQTMNQVHQTGQDIANHRETFQKGMEYQANSDSINTLNVGERAASDQSVNAGYGWSSGPVYVDADNIAHATAKQMYESAQSQIQDVAAKYTQGILSQAEVTQSLADIAKQANHTLTETVQNALPHFQTYMQNHPQFDLAEVGEAMNYLVQNPEAISKMYQGMTDVTNMGESLTGLTMSQVEALQSLPSDMQTTLFGAASTAALAYNTARTATEASKKDYGNEITDMVNEYATTQEAVAQESNSKAV